jgi:hypothetical protein
MKTLLLTLTLLFSTSVSAYGYHGGGRWVAPAIVGGVVVGSVIASQPYIYNNPYQYPPNGYYPQPVYQQVYDPYCNCYRMVRVQ